MKSTFREAGMDFFFFFLGLGMTISVLLFIKCSSMSSSE